MKRSSERFERTSGFRKSSVSSRLAAGSVSSPRVSSWSATRGRALWEIPVKRVGRIEGSEGSLIVGRDRIVYKSEKPCQSVTWRYKGIDNISSYGEFQLSLVTLNDSYCFQLKRALAEDRYDDLWRRVNQTKGWTPVP